jgi:hypothetical protein
MTSGTENRARKRHITIRLSDAERAALDAKAERAGLTPGSYARQVLFGAPMPRQVRRPPVERALLAKLLGEVGAVGNNVNQIARALNRGRDLYDGPLTEAFGHLRDIRDSILVALGREP